MLQTRAAVWCTAPSASQVRGHVNALWQHIPFGISLFVQSVTPGMSEEQVEQREPCWKRQHYLAWAHPPSKCTDGHQHWKNCKFSLTVFQQKIGVYSIICQLFRIRTNYAWIRNALLFWIGSFLINRSNQRKKYIFSWQYDSFTVFSDIV